MICWARSAQGHRCAREAGHVGCHEVYVDGDGRRWWGDARVTTTRDAVTDAFADSAAMEGNEAHFDRVLSEHEEAVRAVARSDALVEALEAIREPDNPSGMKIFRDVVARHVENKLGVERDG